MIQVFNPYESLFSTYRPSIHISLGAGNWDSIENEAQFIQIMQAFGQSFMQPDITIFKHNLEAMESLNSKYKLYHKVRSFYLLNLMIYKMHWFIRLSSAYALYYRFRHYTLSEYNVISPLS